MAAPGARAAGWCDDYHLGYQRVLVGLAKYNFVTRLQVPASAGYAERNAASHQVVDLNQTTPKNVFVGAMVKGQQINPNFDGAGAILNVAFRVDCGKTPAFCKYGPGGTPWYPDGEVWCSTLPSVGTFDWRWIGLDAHTCGVGYRDAAGRWVPAPIASVDVVAHLANAVGIASFDLMQLRQYDAGQAAVTFMFDDGYKSVVTQALPILRSYRYPGSAAILTGVVGTAGYVAQQDLRDLANAGWDVAAHSVTHPSIPPLPLSAGRSELVNSKTFLTSLGLTVDSFVWPYGDYTQATIGLAQTLVSSAPLFASARGTRLDDNAYGTFPYEVKVLEIEKRTSLADVRSWIRDLKDNPACTQRCSGRWGVFLMHDLRTNPGDYDTTPDFLKALAKDVSISGLDVVNYRTGYKRFADVPRP